MAQDADPEFPDGFYWRCTAAMDGADGRFSGSLDVDENGGRALTIEWDGTQRFAGADLGTPGVLRLRAMWLVDQAQPPFDAGRLQLLFEAGRTLPEFGYFDFGTGPTNGTFVVSFLRYGPDRKSASAALDLANLKRWAAGQDQLHWRMQGGRGGVGFGKWVTDGVLPMAFLPRLEVEYDRFRSALLEKAARPEDECEKAPFGNEIMI